MVCGPAGRALQADGEAGLLAKTTAERYLTRVARVGELHPSDVRCIERFDEAELADAFGASVTAGVQGTG